MLKWVRWGWRWSWLALLTAASATDIQRATAQAVPTDGIVCTTNRQQHLYPDHVDRLHRHVRRQHGLHGGLCAEAASRSSTQPGALCKPGRHRHGDPKNTLAEDVSIIWPGECVGQWPAVPQFDGGGNLIVVDQRGAGQWRHGHL